MNSVRTAGGFGSGIKGHVTDRTGVQQSMNRLQDKYPNVADRYTEDSGTSQGSVGSHTVSVGNQWEKQISPEEIKDISSRWGSDLTPLLNDTLALHDIGKGEAVEAGEKWNQHDYTVPLLQDTLRQEGHPERDIHLATELVNHDLLGNLMQNSHSPDTQNKVAAEIARKAEVVGMPTHDFATLQLAFYHSDSGAYPSVRNAYMRDDGNGKLAFKDGEHRMGPVLALARTHTPRALIGNERSAEVNLLSFPLPPALGARLLAVAALRAGTLHYKELGSAKSGNWGHGSPASKTIGPRQGFIHPNGKEIVGGIFGQSDHTEQVQGAFGKDTLRVDMRHAGDTAGHEFHGNQWTAGGESGVRYYRGSNPGDTRKITTGNPAHDEHLFVTDKPENAKWYGSQIEAVDLVPSAKILKEGTREFQKIAGKGNTKSMLDWSSNAITKAKAAGYDVIHFTRQTDIGTVVLNPKAVKSRTVTNLSARSASRHPESAIHAAAMRAGTLHYKALIGTSKSGNWGHGRKDTASFAQKLKKLDLARLPIAAFDPTDERSFSEEVSAYPKNGHVGINATKDSKRNTLLYRDENGKIVGVLHLYIKSTSMSPKGEISIQVDPQHRGKGVASSLLIEADKRWDVDLSKQRWTDEGAQFIERMRDKAASHRFKSLESWWDRFRTAIGTKSSGNYDHQGRKGEVGGSGSGLPHDGHISQVGLDKRFPVAGEVVSGLTIPDFHDEQGPDIPNMSSISASLTDYEILDGVREVKMSDFEDNGKPSFYSSTEEKRVNALADQIKWSKEITPLIVVVDKSDKGPYVLEGGHRFDALKLVGVKSFPALVVVDTEDLKILGSAKSGNYGHAGRKGEVGGSGSQRASKDETNQLTSQEQAVAQDKLSTLPTSKDSEIAKAYNTDTVDVQHLGMTDDKWSINGKHPLSDVNGEKYGRVMKVPLQGIGTSQDAVPKAGLKAYIQQMPDIKKNGHINVAVDTDGKYHLLDGHTRAGATALSGRSHLVARVYQFDKDNHWIREKPGLPRLRTAIGTATSGNWGHGGTGNARSNAWFDHLHRVGSAQGSNKGGTFTDDEGQKWYVKEYYDPRQGPCEQISNDIYRAVGAKVPDSVISPDGRYASKWMSDAGDTLGAVGLTPDSSKAILDHFAADVFVDNWDAVGTGHDNILVDKDGSVTRVDQGGTLIFRAQGGLKPESSLGAIGEWKTLADRNMNSYYAQVFKSAGVKNADAISGIDHQIDRIVAARPAAGWESFARASAPHAPESFLKQVGAMLESRQIGLVAKQRSLKAAGSWFERFKMHVLGSAKSGNYAHKGRPGEVGGSGEGGTAPKKEKHAKATKEQIAKVWEMYKAGSPHAKTAAAVGLNHIQTISIVYKLNQQQKKLEDAVAAKAAPQKIEEFATTPSPVGVSSFYIKHGYAEPGFDKTGAPLPTVEEQIQQGGKSQAQKENDKADAAWDLQHPKDVLKGTLLPESTKAYKEGYEWKAKPESTTGKYAWYKNGVQVSAAHDPGDIEKAVGNINFGKGLHPEASILTPAPGAPYTSPFIEKGAAKDLPGVKWPVADDVVRQMGKNYQPMMEKMGSTWDKTLTTEQHDAIHRYTGYHSDTMNAELRDPKNQQSDQVKQWVKDASSAIATFPTPPPPELVWRGVGAHGKAEFLGHLEKNDIVTLNGFQSTSIHPEFCSTHSTVFEIKPKSGAYTHTISDHGEEYEYTMGHGQRYAVRGVINMKYGHTKYGSNTTKSKQVIQLEEL